MASRRYASHVDWLLERVVGSERAAAKVGAGGAFLPSFSTGFSCFCVWRERRSGRRGAGAGVSEEAIVKGMRRRVLLISLPPLRPAPPPSPSLSFSAKLRRWLPDEWRRRRL